MQIIPHNNRKFNNAHPEVRKVFGDAAVVQKDKRKRQVIFGQFPITIF